MLKRNSRGLFGLICALMLSCIPLQGALAEPPEQEAYGAGSTRVEVIQDLGVRGSGARYEKGAGTMVVDGLVVRPISFLGTILGAVAFVLTLPFSAAGGNVNEAAEYLVVGPAEYTFSRCLGCFDDRYFETSRDR